MAAAKGVRQGREPEPEASVGLSHNMTLQPTARNDKILEYINIWGYLSRTF